MLYGFYIEINCNGLVKVSKKTHAYSVRRNESKKAEKVRRRKRIVPRH
jgi:hypothetical protein